MKNSPLSSFEVPYGALLVYSPRGSSETSVKSREVCYGIKNDRPGLIARAVQVLGKKLEGDLEEFFGTDRLLVPVPRSTPMKEGALWPGLRICEEMRKAGMASGIRACLIRTKAVQKSATAGWGERPDPDGHVETLACAGDMLPHQITLVDDVLTRGSTMIAAASVIQAAFPNATVRTFAMVRTMGLVPEVSGIVEPCVGVVKIENGRPVRNP